MNSTITNFGYPTNLVKEYANWVVMIRPMQLTLGSLVLACKEDAESFGDISTPSQEELSMIIKDIERTLRRCFDYSKINYLMLMMVDPHVHFHVFPRYREPRIFAGTVFEDFDWPAPPDVLRKREVSEQVFNAVREEIISGWDS